MTSVHKFRATLAFTLAATALSLPVRAEDYPADQVLTGAPAPSKEECLRRTNAVWATVDGTGDCLVYWSYGLTSSTPAAVFYIHGDRIWDGKMTSYSDNNAKAQQDYADAAGRSLGLPFIRISRPGLYGSSGNHSYRRQDRELKLMASAVEQIVTRYKIADIAFTGQSGGGSVAAYLLYKFPQARCAVFTSSALSLDGLKKAGQKGGYDYGAKDIYDPIKHLSELPRDTTRRIFVIGDEQDSYALFPNQVGFYDAAKSAGHDITLMKAEGDGHHGLDVTGQHVAAWCLQGASTSEIEEKIAKKEVTY